MNYAIILAGGKGKRFSSTERKQFFKIGSKTILELTLEKFCSHQLIDRIVVVLPENSTEFSLNWNKIYKLAPAGKERKFSVLNGLNKIKDEVDDEDNILIHDGVRPFVSSNLITKVLDELKNNECVIPGLKIEDTLKLIDDENNVIKTVERERYVRVQTPQGFKGKVLNIFLQNVLNKENFTDDASIFEKCGIKVKVIEGEKNNIKITTQEDVMNFYSNITVGIGYDIHRFIESRELYLGGIKIEYKYGLEGHSDADVLIHSIIDAILGATGFGDIGELFPDSDEIFKNIRSTILLENVLNKISNEFVINNVDATIVCEKPKLRKYKGKIKKKLAEIINIPAERINIKATTNEKLGCVGREEGIAVFSIVSMLKVT